MNLISFITVTTATLLFSFSAFAFDWNIVEGDQRLSGEQVKQMVFGKKVKLKNSGTEHYKKNGKYQYKYKSKTYPEVEYKFLNDGSRCMTFETGEQRCDLYVKYKGKLVLINKHGNRFLAKVK